tara:strand:- start:162 stop:320 length:159 start_codon:yes stop_codon:yes gene_type:complete
VVDNNIKTRRKYKSRRGPGVEVVVFLGGGGLGEVGQHPTPIFIITFFMTLAY